MQSQMERNCHLCTRTIKLRGQVDVVVVQFPYYIYLAHNAMVFECLNSNVTSKYKVRSCSFHDLVSSIN